MSQLSRAETRKLRAATKRMLEAEGIGVKDVDFKITGHHKATLHVRLKNRSQKDAAFRLLAETVVDGFLEHHVDIDLK